MHSGAVSAASSEVERLQIAAAPRRAMPQTAVCATAESTLACSQEGGMRGQKVHSTASRKGGRSESIVRGGGKGIRQRKGELQACTEYIVDRSGVAGDVLQTPS